MTVTPAARDVGCLLPNCFDEIEMGPTRSPGPGSGHPRHSTATERLAAAGVSGSVGTVDDAYENALAQLVIGLFRTELIKPHGPWRTPSK